MMESTDSLRSQLLEAGIARLDFAFCYYTDTTHLDNLHAFNSAGLEVELDDALRWALHGRDDGIRNYDWFETHGITDEAYGVYSWLITSDSVVRAGEYQLTNPFEIDGSDALYYRTSDSETLITAQTWTSAQPFDDLERIPDNSDVFLRRALAGNPSAPTHTIARLAGDADERTRTLARQHRFLNQRTVNAIDEDQKMALTPNLEPELLEILVESQWSLVRQAVALHPRLSQTSLERLINDPIPQVGVAVAGNQGAPDHLVTRALKRLESLSGNIREDIASDKATPIQALEVLSRDWLLPIRRAVMRNGATPLHVLQSFALECDSAMRAELLQDYGVYLEILDALIGDPDENIRSKAEAKLRAFPQRQRTDSGTDDAEPAGLSKREAWAHQKRIWAQSKLAWQRHNVAYDERTPDDILELFVNDPHG
jgi:hypothetical protein